MKFVTDGANVAIAHIAKSLELSLASGKVLWLTSGGSAIQIQVTIMAALRETIPEKLANLIILPVDERFGEFGHGNSNTAQMRKTGFQPDGATWYDLLEKNMPMSETVSYYADLAEEAFAEANVVVATLGMGADAHTAGLLPGSAAVTDTVSTAVGYSWSDYERLTLGLSMLLKIDYAYVLAYGETKKEALERLQKNEEPVKQLPVKILYDIADVTVYNDYINT